MYGIQYATGGARSSGAEGGSCRSYLVSRARSRIWHLRHRVIKPLLARPRVLAASSASPDGTGADASPRELPRPLRLRWHEEMAWDPSQCDGSALARAGVKRRTPEPARSAPDASLKGRVPTAIPLNKLRRCVGPKQVSKLLHGIVARRRGVRRFVGFGANSAWTALMDVVCWTGPVALAQRVMRVVAGPASAPTRGRGTSAGVGDGLEAMAGQRREWVENRGSGDANTGREIGSPFASDRATRRFRHRCQPTGSGVKDRSGEGAGGGGEIRRWPHPRRVP